MTSVNCLATCYSYTALPDTNQYVVYGPPTLTPEHQTCSLFVHLVVAVTEFTLATNYFIINSILIVILCAYLHCHMQTNLSVLFLILA